MRFSDVIGQQTLKNQLIQSVQIGRISHAQLFWGPAGTGKLALALAYSQFILCRNRSDEDSCGVCPSCQKVSKLVHPDLHFFYPTTTTKKVKKDAESKLFAEEWRKYVIENKAYVGLQQWYDFLGVENKQGTIFVRDAAEINRLLSYKAYEGETKIVIIWMVEKLHPTAANKLLKLLEEPPDKTLFVLIAEQIEQILTTIKSRTYQVKIPRIAHNDLLTALSNTYDRRQADVYDIALTAHGNWLEALRLYENAEDEKENFHNFQQWMRLCYRGAVNELIDFCSFIAGIGREKQKAFLNYGLHLMRNTLMFNHNLSHTVRLPADENEFTRKFSTFVHHNNIFQITALLEEGIVHIERNGYAQLIFMDTSLKMIGLLRIKA